MSKANFLPKVRAITLDLRVSPGGERRRELNANMIKLPVNMTACNGAMLTNLIMGGVIKGEEWVAEAFHLGTLTLALWRCRPNDHAPHPNPPTPPHTHKFVQTFSVSFGPRPFLTRLAQLAVALRLQLAGAARFPFFCCLFEKKLATCAAKHVVKTLCSHPDRTVTAQRIY